MNITRDERDSLCAHMGVWVGGCARPRERAAAESKVRGSRDQIAALWRLSSSCVSTTMRSGLQLGGWRLALLAHASRAVAPWWPRPSPPKANGAELGRRGQCDRARAFPPAFSHTEAGQQSKGFSLGIWENVFSCFRVFFCASSIALNVVLGEGRTHVAAAHVHAGVGLAAEQHTGACPRARHCLGSCGSRPCPAGLAAFFAARDNLIVCGRYDDLNCVCLRPLRILRFWLTQKLA